MSRSDRVAVLCAVGVAALIAIGLLIFASGACPRELPGQPCPDAGSNRMLVIGAAALAVAFLAAPLAFLAEFALRRRIVYRGAWARAMRRAVLIAAVIVALAGLRLGGALTVPVAIFVVLLGAAMEWFAIRRLDRS